MIKISAMSVVVAALIFTVVCAWMLRDYINKYDQACLFACTAMAIYAYVVLFYRFIPQ